MRARLQKKNLVVRLLALCMFSSMSGGALAAQSAQDVAHELANPNASLGFFAFPIDYVSYDGDLPESGQQETWKMAFQPSLPYPIADDVNFFLRPLIPVIF